MRYKEILFFIWVSWLVKVKTLKDKLSFREIEFISSKINIVSSPKTHLAICTAVHTPSTAQIYYTYYIDIFQFATWKASFNLRSKWRNSIRPGELLLFNRYILKQHPTRRVTSVKQIFGIVSDQESYCSIGIVKQYKTRRVTPLQQEYSEAATDQESNRNCETASYKEGYSCSTGIVK